MSIANNRSKIKESEQEILNQSKDDLSNLLAVMSVGYDPVTGNSIKIENTVPMDTRFDPDDSTPDYIGVNSSSNDATTSDTTWLIYKFTYSGSNVTRIQRAKGSWDDRATYF